MGANDRVKRIVNTNKLAELGVAHLTLELINRHRFMLPSRSPARLSSDRYDFSTDIAVALNQLSRQTMQSQLNSKSALTRIFS